jgi:hypothetical protein
MNIRKESENIVYKDYTSTSIEKKYLDDSSRPDSLINIMRDCVIILQEEHVEEENKEFKNR